MWREAAYPSCLKPPKRSDKMASKYFCPPKLVQAVNGLYTLYRMLVGTGYMPKHYIAVTVSVLTPDTDFCSQIDAFTQCRIRSIEPNASPPPPVYLNMSCQLLFPHIFTCRIWSIDLNPNLPPRVFQQLASSFVRKYINALATHDTVEVPPCYRVS